MKQTINGVVGVAVIRDKNVIWFKTLLKSGASYSTYRSSIDDVFALQYTGGTTGISKGVKLTQKSLLANVAQCLDVIKINNDFLYCSTTISPLPLYHIYAYALCFGILPAIRGHSVLIPDPRNTASFIKVLKKNKFDIFCGLNGRTTLPRFFNARQSPATSTDLPTSDPVP